MSPPSQRPRPPTLLTTSASTSPSAASFSQDISRAILSAATQTPKSVVALPDRATRESAPLEWEFPLPPPPPPSPVETRGHARGFWLAGFVACVVAYSSLIFALIIART
ncbi:hypothetical protein BO71DRAFT_436198 [Aspergillus ellipticus CBS 707.79]|uniref:Uncharacterized protein n=1 Tax=Aspergillus ellipticus CBS 707.79 TaxID=1448320 RepID=A0A319CU99_9EURO|nr:hypothetical protein BO71DRAFT_436198 [Aspergillus ellipticus CBS 707.79]